MTTSMRAEMVRRPTMGAAAEHFANTSAAAERFFGDNADAIARACHAMAQRYEEQALVGPGLVQRREDADGGQRHVGGGVADEDQHKAGEDGGDAAKKDHGRFLKAASHPRTNGNTRSRNGSSSRSRTPLAQMMSRPNAR